MQDKLDKLRAELADARMKYRESVSALDDHGTIYYGAQVKKLTAKISAQLAKLENTKTY